MRKTIIAGNWKMNLHDKTVGELIKGISDGINTLKSNAEMIVFPSAIHLRDASNAFKNTRVKVGAQNIYPSGLAAFTGEISCAQLRDLNIEHVLVGHSERRQFLGETDVFLNKKILHILQEKMIPVFCIGETLEEREAGKTFSIIETQIVEGLKGVAPSEITNIIIAYEPVWAIGTGKVATPEQAEEVHDFIRKKIVGLYDADKASKISILYGGSVKPDNIESLLGKPNIDGGLVGGASQKAESFLALFGNS